MKKFNYQFTVEAPSQELSDLIVKMICNENRGVITEAKAEIPEKTAEKKAEAEKKSKEDTVRFLERFEKALHIIKCCVMDNTLIDRFAQILGYQPQKTPVRP